MKCLLRVVLTQTVDRGYGMQALAPISSGSLIIEYCGEVISHDECYRRLSSYDLMGVHDFYMMELSSHLMLDARQQGNAARFINHSCDPNCGTQVWTVGSQQRVGIFALRDIEVGEEITYNYRAQTFNARGQHNNVVQACRCGASNCSSFLGEKPTTRSSKVEQKPKRKRTARAPADSRSRDTDSLAEQPAAKKRRPPTTSLSAVTTAGKKSTGFGHGLPAKRRMAVKQEVTARQDDDTEDETESAAALPAIISEGGRQEGAVKASHEQPAEQHSELADAESHMPVDNLTVKSELDEEEEAEKSSSVGDETELDTNTSSLSAPTSPSTASLLSTSSLESGDGDSFPLSPSALSTAESVHMAALKPGVALHDIAASFSCVLTAKGTAHADSTIVR